MKNTIEHDHIYVHSWTLHLKKIDGMRPHKGFHYIFFEAQFILINKLPMI